MNLKEFKKYIKDNNIRVTIDDIDGYLDEATFNHTLSISDRIDEYPNCCGIGIVSGFTLYLMDKSEEEAFAFFAAAEVYSIKDYTTLQCAVVTKYRGSRKIVSKNITSALDELKWSKAYEFQSENSGNTIAVYYKKI